MDLEWVADEIERFLPVTAQVVPDMGPGVVYFGTVMRGPETRYLEAGRPRSPVGIVIAACQVARGVEPLVGVAEPRCAMCKHLPVRPDRGVAATNAVHCRARHRR